MNQPHEWTESGRECGKKDCEYCRLKVGRPMNTATPDLSELPITYQAEIQKHGGWYEYRDAVILETTKATTEIMAVNKRRSARLYQRRKYVRIRTDA